MSGRKKPLVVLDTNVIVSGFLSGDTYPSKILDAWLLGYVQVAVSPELKQELNQVFKKTYISKILLNQKSIKPILGKCFNKSLMVLPKSISEIVFPDEKDHFLLELAVTAKAIAIVTGDKKLLNIKKTKSILIYSPKQFCLKFKITA